MNKLCLAMVGALLTAGGVASAQPNDSWEPNNSVAASVPMSNHFGSSGEIGGLQLQQGPPAGGPATQERRWFEDSVISPGDEDWYEIVAPVTGTLTVYMRQVTNPTFRLTLQVLNQAGTQVLAGPTSGTYATFSTTGAPADRFDGARAQTAATQGTTYNLKIYYAPGGNPMPTNTQVPYSISVEWGTPDASESTYSNNFPGLSPRDEPGQEADATPAAPGAANARVLTNRSYNGFDYYVVRLNQPATITFRIENLVPLAPTFNFDVYWVQADGAVLSNVLLNGTAMQGAEDSFPTGYPALVVVPTPRTFETLTTPALVPGAYYFQVTCLDTSTGAIQNVHVGGNYGVRCSITGQTDDTLEGVATNQNDFPSRATTLPAGTTNNLRLLNGFNLGLNPGDPLVPEEDWYKIQVTNGGNLEVRLVVNSPLTDNIDIRLYKPNATNPGIAADLLDWSTLDNRDVLTKGAETPREIVGTWGTVGVNGNSSLPDGEYLLRITQGSLLLDCVYSLIVTLPGGVNIAPEDQHEPNDTLGTATIPSSTFLELPRGLSTGLKCMDQVDWYRFTASRNDNIQVTLRYDAGPDVDLDIALLDLNGGPDFALNQVTAFLGAPNDTIEINPGTLAQVQATAGTSWVAANKIAPQNGFIYIRVQRWGTRGAAYELNINVNNGNPLPPLVVQQVSATPGTIAVPSPVNIAVAIRNQGAFNATLQTLTLKLTHSGGADVTGEYTIANVAPTLPEVIQAAQTNPYLIVVTPTASTTSGTITASVTGTTDTGLPLVGNPVATFIVTGGLAPTPRLVYNQISVFGTLKPAGVAFIQATVHNEGTQGGLYDNAGLGFNFAQAAANVTSGFSNGVPIATSPQLPVVIGAGTTLDIVFTFSIKPSVGLGTTSVTVSGGGPQNPVNPGKAQFEIKPQFATKSPPEECSVTAGAPFAPPLAVMMMAGIAFFRRRRE